MEDDPLLGEILTDYLKEYYVVDRVFDSAEALNHIDESSYDLFIFDINVPGKSGIGLLKELREYHDTTPAIIITAYEDTKHLEQSFDAGAHDYIKKPFELEELRLRIQKSKVLFNIEQDKIVNLDKHTTYNPTRKIIQNQNNETLLAPKEANLLDYFLAHPSRTISTEELVQNIWSYDTMPTDATIRSHIRNLRELVGRDRIITQRGVGYRYE